MRTLILAACARIFGKNRDSDAKVFCFFSSEKKALLRGFKAALTSIGLMIAYPCQAASLSVKDVQIIARSLGFLDPAPAGGVIAVVYSGKVSKADAESVVANFGEGLASSGGTVTARSVDIGSLGDGAGYIAIIIPSGLTTNFAGKTHGIPCITGSIALVRSGACIMAVQSDPKVSITVNRAAAQEAGIGFASAFAMLVHEI